MKFTVLDPELFGKDAMIFPDYVEKKMQTRDAFIVGAWEEKALAGIAVFWGTAKGGIELSWIYTAEKFRRQGVAYRLCGYAEKRVKGMGYKSIGCSLFADMEAAERIYGLMKKTGFEPRVLNWHIMEYNTNIVLDYSRKMKLTNSVKVFRTLEQNELVYLLRRDKKNPSMISLARLVKRADMKESLFYVKDNSLKACLLMGTGREKEADILTLYRSPYLKEIRVIPALLACGVQRLEGRFPKPEKVIFYVENEWNQKLYETIFGLPVKDCLVQHYVKKL